MRGLPLRDDDWAGVTVPTLVPAGGKSELILRNAPREIVDVLPNARHKEIPELSHNPNPRVLAEASAPFLVEADAPSTSRNVIAAA